jgi:hypothetical protein
VKALAPPDNPFFRVDGLGVDWQGLMDHLGKHPDVQISADDKKNMGYAVAAAAAVSPIFGAVAGALVTGLIAVDSMMAEDENGHRFADGLARAMKGQTDRGFLPAMPRGDKTLEEQLLHFPDMPDNYPKDKTPYHQWLINEAGRLFQKWGGEPELSALGTKFVVGDYKNFGSSPSIGYDTHQLAIQKNEPRLTLAALGVAYEYGVQSHAKEVVDAAIEACRKHAQIFADQRYVDYGYEGAENSPFMAFEFGMYAAMKKAATLAGVASPPELTPRTYAQPADAMVQQQQRQQQQQKDREGSGFVARDFGPSALGKPGAAGARGSLLRLLPRAIGLLALDVPSDPDQKARHTDVNELPDSVGAENPFPANDAYRQGAIDALNSGDGARMASWVKDLRSRGFDKAAATISAAAVALGYTGSDLFIPNPAIENLAIDELPDTDLNGDGLRMQARAVYYGGPPGIYDSVWATSLHRMGYDAAAYQFLVRARQDGRIWGIENLAPPQ